MYRTVKARFTNGAFVPVEEVGIEEGEELLISFSENHLIPMEERIRRFKAAAGSWKGLVDGDAMIREIYEARRIGSGLPPDENEDE